MSASLFDCFDHHSFDHFDRCTFLSPACSFLSKLQAYISGFEMQSARQHAVQQGNPLLQVQHLQAKKENNRNKKELTSQLMHMDTL